MFKANRWYIKAAQVLKGPAKQHLCWSWGPFVLQSLIKSDFMYIAPGQGQKTPWGQTFDVNRKPLSFSTICCKFQTNLFEFRFYAYFLMFFHMYIAPGQGQTTLCGRNPDVNRKTLSLCPFVASVKRYLWSLILYIIFHVFIHVYSPGAGAENPLGSEFLCKHIPHVTLVIC